MCALLPSNVAGNMGVLKLLLDRLPSHFEPQLTSRDLLLLVSKSFLDWESGTHPLLVRGQAAAQLSTSDVVQLLLCLMPQASQVNDGVDREDCDAVHKDWGSMAADFKVVEQKLCGLLGLLLPTRQLTTANIVALLQRSVSLGLLQVTQKLLGVSMGCAEQQDGKGVTPMSVCEASADQASQQCSSGDLLGQAELHELLLCCAELNLDQLLGGYELKLDLFECLLGRAALYGFDGASVCSLVAALFAGFPWDRFWRHLVLLMEANSTSTRLDHPVLQLLRLPGLDVLDADVMCAVLHVCMADVHMDLLVRHVLELLLLRSCPWITSASWLRHAWCIETLLPCAQYCSTQQPLALMTQRCSFSRA
jgi:hypothetical protein